jgi:hypothetical protein
MVRGEFQYSYSVGWVLNVKTSHVQYTNKIGNEHYIEHPLDE